MNKLRCNALLLFCIICTSTFTIVFFLFTTIDRCSKIGGKVPREAVQPSAKSAVKSHGKTYYLVILILSSPDNVDKRSVIRSTWLQLCSENEVHYFVIGTKNISPEARSQLEKEFNYHQDIVFVEDVEDSYSFLTRKVLESFVWLNKNVNFQYLLKCDDDTFVNVGKLVSLLYDYKNDSGLYLGFFSGHGTVQKGGKWKESEWVLCDYYLPYALGGGYVLSHSLVKYIVKNARDLILFQSEDVSVGVWLANKANVKRIHSPFFDTEYKSRGCSDSYVVTHKHDEVEQRILYRNLQLSGKMCEKEYQNRLSYVYDWSVPPSKCCVRSNRTIP